MSASYASHLASTGAARLRSTPLRVKLVSAVLALVFAALTLISVSSTFALRRYLLGRVDDELASFAVEARSNTRYITAQNLDDYDLSRGFPSEYMLGIYSFTGVGNNVWNGKTFTADDMPPHYSTLASIEAHIAVQPYTVSSTNGQEHWRMLITNTEQGDFLYVGRNLSEVEGAVGQLVWLDLLIGGAVLIALASVGAGVVRTSLRPLTNIEKTAAAIAAGDLTRRVPDPEPDRDDPQSELGRLSKALNAMLTQIEAAFTARAHSELAARAAESSARDAAEAAKLSEARAVRSEGKMRQFVADASHELRTPLTTIRGFAELYRQGAVQDPEDVARLVRRIEDEASRMGLLVEDLLLLARLDRERPIALAPVELPVLAIDAVQAAQAVAPERSIELDIQDKSEDLIAYGDDARLRQVIGNLMTNALVHTPPEASVTLRLYAESGNRAVVEIADTGPGLSESQRDHVFERFYRADEARTRHTDREATGTGLGLAIVAAIVRAHNGTVEVISPPGQGATFRVTLPALPFTENIQA